MIDVALYLGGEEIEENIADSMDATQPFWLSSGDGPGARCDNNFTDQFGDCSITQSGVTNWNYLDGERWKKTPGCENYTTALPPTGFNDECGSDGYKIAINASELFTFGRIAPSYQANFISGNTFICNNSFFKNSNAEHNFTFDLWEQTALGGSPTVYSWDIIGTYSLTGSSSFHSGGDNYEVGETCRATITLTHIMDPADLTQMEIIQNEYFEDIGNRTIFVTISINDLETSNGRSWDTTSIYSPFEGGSLDVNYMNFKALTYEVDAVGATLRFGIFIFGIGLWAVAIASTPYWDPLASRLSKKGGNL